MFFALWPDAQERARIQAVAKRIALTSGVFCHESDFHITLAFIGATDSVGEQCLQRAANQVALRAFDFDIERLDYFPEARILWLGPQAASEPLSTLAKTLWQHLKCCGYCPEHRAYIPHITLARKAEPCDLELSFAPIKWTVTEFCLAESVSGGPSKYRVLKKFPLSQ